MCDVVYINPNNGEEGIERNVIKLYNPITQEPPGGACYPDQYPLLLGDIQMLHTNPPIMEGRVYKGEEVDIAYSLDHIFLCDGSPAPIGKIKEVKFFVSGEEKDASYDTNRGLYYVRTSFDEAGPATITVSVTIETDVGEYTVQKPAITPYIHDPAGSSDRPIVSIANLEWAYSEGQTIYDLSCNTNAQNPTYEWTIVCPGLCPNGQPIQNFFDQNIPAFQLPDYQQGNYGFECEVTAEDGITKASDSRTVGVYGPDVPIPSQSMVLPWAATVGIPFNVRVGNPHPDFTYVWDFADNDQNQQTQGVDFNHTYFATGTFGVTVTAIWNQDPSVTFTSNYHFISVGTTPVPLPVFTHQHNPPPPNTGSGYNIDFDASNSYSPVGANIISYEITYGDSPNMPDEVNTTGVFQHTYPNPGSGNTAKYSVHLKIIDDNFEENTTTMEVTVWGD
jgi:hypothetical protein